MKISRVELKPRYFDREVDDIVMCHRVTKNA